MHSIQPPVTVERHLEDMVEYVVPKAGMFLWMRLKGGEHGLNIHRETSSCLIRTHNLNNLSLLVAVEDSNDLIMERAIEKKVLMVPGASFIPTNGDVRPISSYVRASYSTASVEEMNEACLRLRELLSKEN